MAETKTPPLTLLSPGHARAETVKDQALTQCQAHIQDLLTQIDVLLRESADYEAVKQLLQNTPADLLELLQPLLCARCPNRQRTG